MIIGILQHARALWPQAGTSGFVHGKTPRQIHTSGMASMPSLPSASVRLCPSGAICP